MGLAKAFWVEVRRITEPYIAPEDDPRGDRVSFVPILLLLHMHLRQPHHVLVLVQLVETCRNRGSSS